MTEVTRRGTVLARISAYLAERFPQIGVVTEETPLLSSGAIDSLGALDLLMHISTTYALPIEDMDVTAGVLETPGTLADFVLSRLSVAQ